MSPHDRPDHQHDEALRAIQDAEMLEALKKDHAAFFAVIAAAPDLESAVATIALRFDLPSASAERALHQPISQILPRRRDNTTR